MTATTIADLIQSATLGTPNTPRARIIRNIEVMVNNPAKWGHYAHNMIKAGKFWDHMDLLVARIDSMKEEDGFSGLIPEERLELMNLIELRDFLRSHVKAA